MDVSWITGASLVAFAYFLGSVPFGVLVTRWFAGEKVDLRTSGSGNIGATNVSRVAGRKAGILTLLLDAGKGIFALVLAKMVLYPLTPGLFGAKGTGIWISAVAAAAFLGHVFSVYLHFKGGKGVATAFGVVLFLSPTVAFLLVVIFVAVLRLTRYVSASSLAAALALPVLMAFFGGRAWYEVTLSLLLAFLVFHTHRENIHRLWQGTENRFGR